MPAASNQMQNPYPRGTGTGSVPVLFSLRNVQPKIFAAASQDESAASKTQPPESNGTPAVLASTIAPAASGAVKPSTTTSTGVVFTNVTSRFQNVAIALLLFALFVLVVRNSQGGKARSLADNRELTLNTELDSVGVGMGASLIATPQSSNVDVDLKSKIATSQDEQRNQEPLEIGINPSSGANAPPIPLLLDNTASSTKAATEHSESNKNRTLDFPSDQPNLSAVPNAQTVPNARPYLASKPTEDPRFNDRLSTDRSSGTTNLVPEPTGNASPVNNTAPMPTNVQNSPSTLVDTGIPMETNELIKTYREGVSTVPSNTVSYPKSTPILDNAPRDPQPWDNPSDFKRGGYTNAPNPSHIMTGQAYPPLSPSYQPINVPGSPNNVQGNANDVPAYERNAQSQRGGSAYSYGDTSSGMIRQPNSTSRPLPNGQPMVNGSNRYQGTVVQPTTTRQPYMPYGNVPPAGSPSQTGNSTGYPPSN